MAQTPLPPPRGNSPPPLGRIYIWEALGAALALLLGFHFLALRVQAGGLPGGDEGSWLSVAAELSRGHGFSTRWLEGHFLLPYTLPRPDDFRYPALTSLLALVFKFAGIYVEAGRWTVAAVFLCFASATYFTCRAAFGRWTGMAALWLTTCSLLQLEWNSIVYTEGLFGLVVAGLAYWCLVGERSNIRFNLTHPVWWAVLGSLIGVLYLVRPNALLFLPGICWLYWRRRHLGLSWLHPILALAGFALATLPWLIRTYLHFGNPFHIAGNAGFLREAGQSHTLTLFQFMAQHNPYFPLERVVIGVPRFLSTLNFFEHGLEIVPLLAAFVALLLRRSFFGPFLSAGFMLSGAICCYSAYSGWAGIRYMSSMLPFLYAYGLSTLPVLFAKLFPAASKRFSFVIGITGILVLLWPVFHPHRFYERKLIPADSLNVERADHIRRLNKLVPTAERYYAGTLCEVNFLAVNRDCVGLQELYDTTWFTRSMKAFHPGFMVLTHKETGDSLMQATFKRMRAAGYTHDTLDSGPLAVYLALRLTSTGPGP